MQIMHIYVKAKSKKINEEKEYHNKFFWIYFYLFFKNLAFVYSVFWSCWPPNFFQIPPHVPLPTSYPLLFFSSFYNPSNLSCSYTQGYEAIHWDHPSSGPQPWGKLTISLSPQQASAASSSSAGGGYWWATSHGFDLVTVLCRQPQLHSLLKYVNYACVCKNLVKENKWGKEKL